MKRRTLRLKRMAYKIRDTILNRRFRNLLLVVTIITLFYLSFHGTPPRDPSNLFFHKPHISSTATHVAATPTTLRHLLFSIASSARSFRSRQSYIGLWYKPNSTRALVFLDLPVTPSAAKDSSIPPIVISGDTSHFPFTFSGGHPSAIRVARVVKEAVDRNEADVRWYVFGDDDTVFFPENLVSVLSKYDHDKWYYIGATSEGVEANVKNSFEMAFGGAGFAISSSLAKALSGVLDSCLMRYHHLYGSDLRISSCIAELGIGLTKEPGFHQVDLRGNLFGMLTAHPSSPLLSLHHFDVLEPLFPNMSRIEALQHLLKAAHVDPARILQQTVCYDSSKNLTVSVSWGYAIQVYEGNQLLPDILRWQRSFGPWRRRGINTAYQYIVDTREYPQHPCQRPAVFFFESISIDTEGGQTVYSRDSDHNCFQSEEFQNLGHIRASSRKLEPHRQVGSPRRQCCDIVNPLEESMLIKIRQCGPGELIAMNP